MVQISDIILSLLSTVVIYCLIYTYRFHTYWARNGLRGPNFLRSILSYSKVLPFNDLELRKEFGPIIYSYEIFRRVVMITEPKYIKDILVTDFDNFTNRRYVPFGKELDQSIVFARDNQWKRIRSIITPAFSSLKLKSKFKTLCDFADQFCHNIQGSIEQENMLDIKGHVNTFVVNVVLTCGFGIELDVINSPDHPTVVNAKKIFESDLNLLTVIGWIIPDLGRFFKLGALDSGAVRYFKNLVLQVIEMRKTQGTYAKNVDFLQLMLNVMDENLNEIDGLDKKSKIMSIDELTGTALALMLAGNDATSSGICHFFHLIGLYPECQQKLYEELSQVSCFDEQTLDSCEYLNACVSETFRLKPPVVRFDREASEDYVLRDTVILIPKNCIVEFSPYVTHRNPDLFPEPEMFRPERFMNKQLGKFTFIPFGYGLRNCAGQKFGRNELCVLIAKAIMRFKFETPTNIQLDYPKGVLMFMPKEVKIKVTRR